MPSEDKQEDSGLNSKIESVKADIDSIKAKMESFSEVRSATNERFTQLNGMIGEVRGMVNELSKGVTKIEVSATKAIDKVESVQPETLLLEVRKVDAKVEALKANIESNESMMEQLFEQIKQMREKIAVFKGVDGLVQLSQEVKTDLTNSMKVKGDIERHADKVETIFMEFQKEYQEFNQLTDKYKSLEAENTRISREMDIVKIKNEEKSTKKEVENILARINKFEGHVSSTLNLITKKSDKYDESFKKSSQDLKEFVNKLFSKKVEKIDFMTGKLNELVKKNPKIAELLEINPDANLNTDISEQQKELQKKEEEQAEKDDKPVISKEDLVKKEEYSEPKQEVMSQTKEQ